jgi:outer membrane lipoprotein-sorting protein
MFDRSKTQALLGLLLLAGASACGEKGMTYGDANSVIAVTDQARWEQISGTVYDALERTIQTVRDEKTFTVTYQEPYGEYWNNLRRFRQMLLIGTPSDPWMVEALEESRAEVDISAPGTYQIRNAWSRDQTVTLVVLPDDGSFAELPEMMEDVHTTLDAQFREYARSRMFFSGVNEALGDTLQAEAGFRMIVPSVYRWQRADSVLVFRNDQPDPSELIRQVTVTWLSPAVPGMSVDQVIEWRQRIADAHFTEPQALVLDDVVAEPASLSGRESLRIQTQWGNPPDRGWPAGGPMVVHVVTCDEQDRTYLVDAWLYAPGREKYEYMIQLETIVDSFDCGV